MRAVRVVTRAFVYATEDEDRVVKALLWSLGRDDDPEARGRLTRSRAKGHHGGDIVLYESVLKNPRDLRRFFDALRENPDLVSTLREEFDKRLDEDRVLHFRLDKQAAVEQRREIGAGGDAFNTEVKFEDRPGDARQGFPFE